jgi:predicted RNase H-like HicB family nuclease
MKLKAVIHKADEGGLWAEIPEIPGCCAQGLTYEELLVNLTEAAHGCLLCRCDDAEAVCRAEGYPDDLTFEIVE